APAPASSSRPDPTRRLKRVFLFTDGEVSNTEEVVRYVQGRFDATSTPFYVFGIGNSVSTALVQGVADASEASAQ
ncbi:hypothetical protein, partial [Escherichia coli]|uniref:hypothetical protein n=1 Tax=Escherichia coli TaxID=562 RepID=UPI0039DFE5CE